MRYGMLAGNAGYFLKCRCIVPLALIIFYLFIYLNDALRRFASQSRYQVPLVSNYFIFANFFFQGCPYIFDWVVVWRVSSPVQKGYQTRLLLYFLKSLNKINLLDKNRLSIIIWPLTVYSNLKILFSNGPGGIHVQTDSVFIVGFGF